VPAMTLMGYCDAPALLDGITPVPAPMARKLAAGHTDWYRILTDPHTGKFLPLPAEKYRPTTAQLEYLRLVDPICAMPGCTPPPPPRGHPLPWAASSARCPAAPAPPRVTARATPSTPSTSPCPAWVAAPAS